MCVVELMPSLYAGVFWRSNSALSSISHALECALHVSAKSHDFCLNSAMEKHHHALLVGLVRAGARTARSPPRGTQRSVQRAERHAPPREGTGHAPGRAVSGRPGQGAP